MSKAWKALERATAATLGGKRHLRAHRGEPGPDVDLPDGSLLSVECKYRRTVPAIVRDGLAQAAANGGAGKVPLLVLKARGMRGALAVLSLADLARLLAGNAMDSAGPSG